MDRRIASFGKLFTTGERTCLLSGKVKTFSCACLQGIYGCRCITPLILNMEMSGWCHILAAFSMGKKSPFGWAQKPVWNVWRKEKFLAPREMKHDS
jgi:hypothetical protein